MGSCQISYIFIFVAFFSTLKISLAQFEFPVGFDGRERDALLALKVEFNDSFLNENWTGLMCYLNEPPLWFGIACLNGRVTGISLENMALVGKLRTDSLHDLPELSVLSLKNNSISGEMMDFRKNPKMARVDLSRNMFGGLISSSLASLSSLESLQLQDNKLTGKIPDFDQPSLREFNVSNNELSGQIPNTSVVQSFGDASFTGNNELCGPPTSISCDNREKAAPGPETTRSKNKGLFRNALGPILLAIGVVGLIFILLLLFFYYKKNRKLKEEITTTREIGTEIVPSESSEMSFIEGEAKGKLVFMDGNRTFELNDLLRSSAEGLGKGNFGSSYKAELENGSAFVVKRLRDLKPLSPAEFSKQLKAIADQKHPNLLPLVAYFYSKEEKLLVYKFAAYGNVFTRLHGGRESKGRVPFRWAARLSVAQAVARALQYLHINNSSPHIPVPHGNLKSTNVLIDENNNTLVSDYGLTSLIAVPIAAQRFVAYKSPEYTAHKRLSKKSDVWSYGCFLLELLTGRVSVHTRSQGERGVDLGIWVHRAVREEWTAEIFDLEISVQRSANHAMVKLLQIAIRCCDKSPGERPDMTEVVREVENIKVVVDSEDSEDLSVEQSLTDDTLSTSLDLNP